MRIADQYEPKNWAAIAKRMASEFGFKRRTGKQCRERYSRSYPRWFNHLDPTICKKAWSNEEEETLMELQKVYGNKWTLIAEKMPGRYLSSKIDPIIALRTIFILQFAETYGEWANYLALRTAQV
jgi:hypothetical protein